MRVRNARRRRGAAAVELAITLPVLVLLAVIAADFCRLYRDYVIVTNCARNGALWAADPVAQSTSRYGSASAAALADASNLSPAPTVTGPTYATDGSGNPYAEVTVSHDFNMITTYLGFGTVTVSRTVRVRVAPTVPG